MSLPADPSTSLISALPTLTVSLLLRLAFFALCRVYLQHLLVDDLEQVVEEEQGDVSPHAPSYELLDSHRSHSAATSGIKRSAYPSDSDASSSPSLEARDRRRRSSSDSGGASHRSNWATFLSTITFCCTFSESCTLCVLVVTANITGDK